jgi:hypothetical protein
MVTDQTVGTEGPQVKEGHTVVTTSLDTIDLVTGQGTIAPIVGTKDPVVGTVDPTVRTVALIEMALTAVTTRQGKERRSAATIVANQII